MWWLRKTQDPRDVWVTDTSRFALLVEGDGAGGGGDGGSGAGSEGGSGRGNGGGDGAAGAAGPDWEGFTQTLESLNSNLGGGLDTLINEVRGLKPAPQEPPPPNFDEMTQADLAAHIIGAVTRAVEAKLNERLSPVVNSVNGLQQSLSQREVAREIETLKSNRDFNDWKPVMLGLAKEHPTLGVKQLYNLARAENPTRAAELDKKYAPPAEPAKPRWGGLTHGGAASALGGEPAPKVNGHDASREAYKEVQARHSEVLRVLEN